MKEKKALESKVTGLTGKSILRILNHPFHPRCIFLLSWFLFRPNQCSPEPCFAEEKTKIQSLETGLATLKAEMEEVKANHNTAMAKQKKDHDTEIAKMIHDHETELEEHAV